DQLTPRPGCAMEFRANGAGGFTGCVEPGCRCLIPRDGQLTYLVSEVEMDEERWISRDRGFDPRTHDQRWGSEHGALRFRRTGRYDQAVGPHWLQAARGVRL
ncbi:CpcT/CpeT family chromophore lyase, partial [Candidatus Synechococcus spongiarum]|uniref:CpcT/CpeT family chromophore lyase n=1 Tax=Candidatus Synechococcus spongiarum TaxID=431041 RepID=UPI00046F656A